MTENKINKKLDNDLEASNTASQGADLKKPSNKATPKKSAPKKITVSKTVSPDLSAPKNPDLDEYTTDPVTGVKYLKPKGDSVSLGQRNFRIPTIRREGYEIIWGVTRGNELGNLVLQGWDFVDPKTPGCEEAAKTPYAGTDQTSKALFHRALQMPKEKYDAMMIARGKANDQREQDIIYNVKAGVNPADQKGFYVSKDNKMGVEREHGNGSFINSSGMSSGTNNGFSNAMR